MANTKKAAENKAMDTDAIMDEVESAAVEIGSGL